MEGSGSTRWEYLDQDWEPTEINMDQREIEKAGGIRFGQLTKRIGNVLDSVFLFFWHFMPVAKLDASLAESGRRGSLK